MKYILKNIYITAKHLPNHVSTPARLHACTKVVEDRDAILRRLTSERAERGERGEREERGERGERATLPSQAAVAAAQEGVGSGSGSGSGSGTARSTYEQKRSAWAHRVSKVPQHPTPPHTTPPNTTPPSHPTIPPPNTTQHHLTPPNTPPPTTPCLKARA